MINILHSDAIMLEHQIRRLFNCDRTGISGLADADHFEHHPLDAAIMVISYIYAKNLQNNDMQYSQFWDKYETIFEYPEENNALESVKDYISDLSNIVNQIVSR